VEIKIRDFKIDDIDNLIPILLDTWDYSNFSSLENRIEAIKLFLLSCLSCSNYKKVLLLDDKISGIILAKTNKDFIDDYYSSYYKSLSKELKNNIEVNKLIKYNDVIFNAEKKMVTKLKGDYEEVVLLILSSSTKGKGCGRKLLEDFYNIRNKSLPLIIMSDKDCNYRFYEHLGYKKIDEIIEHYDFFGIKKTLEAFLYVKED